jgi:transposase InsO family protein
LKQRGPPEDRDWIADFYNIKRRHSANDGLPPVTFERQMIEKRQGPTALLRAAVA